MKITDKINQIFEGDLNDKTPSHKNSLCRIVYTYYLRTEKFKIREIAKMMKCGDQMVTKRLKRHKDYYQFDRNYKNKIDELFGR
jgi:hypothetical protein